MEHETVLRPSEGALTLAEHMIERGDVMSDILNETIQSAKAGRIKEAGRTFCPGGGEVRGPLKRYPRAVDLASCPVSRGGTFHTHVTADELLHPENSLPDMANVVYGLTDVSAVVGTRSMDMVLAPKEDQAEDAVARFENAIGESISGPRELHNAITSGRIRPTTARKRAREALGDLVHTVETGFPEIEAELDAVQMESVAEPMMSGKLESFTGPTTPMGFSSTSIEEAAENATE
ncbi:MAG: hypothetical protein ACOCTH_02745, partial [Halodesulfurarchaeum sp.]